MSAVSVPAGISPLRLAPGRWPGLLLCVGAVLAVVAGRSFVLGRMLGGLGGRYPIAYVLYDVVAFGTVIAGLRVLDRLAWRTVERWMDDGVLVRRLAPETVHGAVVVAAGRRLRVRDGDA